MSRSTGVRVVHTVADLGPHLGGPSRTVPALCKSLARAGAIVSLVTHYDGSHDDAIATSIGSDVELRLVEKEGHQLLAFIRASRFERTLHDLCLERRVQLCHDHGIWLYTNYAAARVSHRLGLIHVISPRGMLSDWALQQGKWKKRIGMSMYQQQVLTRAAAFFATSMQEAQEIRRLGLTQPIAVIPNGVEVPPGNHTLNARQTKIALFLSRIHPKKGLLLLVEAWNLARPVGWRVIVAGPDEDNHKSEVIAAINRTGLQNLFSFTGAVADNQKSELIQQAELVILPTYSENFGLVVAEALACGVPVITTKGAPWEELVAQGCGWWVDISAEAIAEAITDASRLTAERRREMGARGQAFVKESLSWNAVASKTLATYDWLLGRIHQPDHVVTT